MKVCMFVYNNCKHDARVLKEARTLAEAGYDVRIIAVLDKDTKPYEERDGFKIIRVVKDPIHYRILRRIRDFSVTSWLKQCSGLIIKALFFPAKMLSKIFLFAKTGYKTSERTLTSPKISMLMDRFKRLLWEFNQGIQEKGVMEYIKVSIKEHPVYFFTLGWTLLLGYYTYRYLRKAFYWGVRRPAKIIHIKMYNMIKALLMTFHRPLSFLDYYRRSFELVKQEPADVYHAHDLNTLPVAYWAKRRLGGKLIYDSHELYTETSTLSRLERIIARYMEAFLIRHADKVVTVNQSISKELSKRYKISTPIVVMNCPIINKHSNNLQDKILHKKLGLDDNTFIILYQGGYAPNRGLQNLILSAHYIHEGVIVFMGWGKIEQELKDLVLSEKLNEKVIFTDPVPYNDLLTYTRSASLGVIPYQFVGLNNYYTTPNKLFEYIAAGIPVVGSDFPELRRIIKGYNIGETFNPEDPKDIARAINYILSDKTRYEEMKKNAQKAAQIFNWENESKKLLNIYRLMKKTEDV